MNKTRITYIGNRIAVRGGTPTAIDMLTPLLEDEQMLITTASSRKNHKLRLLEMCYTVIRESRRMDLVLIDTYSTNSFWYAYIIAFLCRLLKLDYIPILHGGALPRRLKHSPGAARFLFSHSLCNVSPSRFLKDIFEENGFGEVIYIPNSIILKDYMFRERLKIAPKLLWVRAFAEIYNPMLAIKVLEEVLKYHPDAELSMVGPEKDDSLSICKQYVREKDLPVYFQGMLKKSQWHALAANYDIFLNTTYVDNTPVSVIEAMALGLPIVSTKVGGIPYLIEEGKEGILVPTGDMREMSQAVLNLLDDPAMAHTIALQARNKVNAFDWEKVRHQWRTVLLQGSSRK